MFRPAISGNAAGPSALRGTMPLEPVDYAPELNPEQYEAVQHVNGPLLILAGAGSGKTRVITYRVAHLIRNVGLDPWRLLAVTFTNKAAGEMRERVEALLNGDLPEAAMPWLSTFHSLCARLLRMHGDQIGLPKPFMIGDDADQRQVLSDAVDALGLDMDRQDMRRLGAMIDDAKNKGLDPDALEDHAVGAEAELNAEVYRAYQEHLRRNGMLDFGDLILEATRLLRTCDDVRGKLHRRWTHLMVDEFQDTNPSQYALLRLLTGPEENLAVVGDDDQAIYRWRGATVRNILEFESDFPAARVVKLERNYRSHQLILDTAGAVIQKVERRRDKTLWTDQKDGEQVVLFTGRSGKEEAAWVARSIQRLVGRYGIDYHQCAIFYRTNAQGRVLEEQLRAFGLPYQIVGGVSFYDRKEIKDILAYLKVAANPGNSVDLRRIINTPRRNIGQRTVAKLEAMAGPGGVVPTLYDAINYVVQTHGGGFSERRRGFLSAFYNLIEELKLQIDQGVGPAALIHQIIERTDYIEHLEKTEPGSLEDRKESLEELIATLEEAEEGERLDLFSFLEQSALVRDTSAETDDDLDLLGLAGQPLKMMTVHASKGLEFDAVFVVGLEDDLFPMLRDDDAEEGEASELMDEERRLFYVALTRARRWLYLSNARSRVIHGKPRFDLKSSRFLDDIPRELMTLAPESASQEVRWGWPDERSTRQRPQWPSRRNGRRAATPQPRLEDGIEYEPEAYSDELDLGGFDHHVSQVDEPPQLDVGHDDVVMEPVIEYDQAPEWPTEEVEAAPEGDDALVGRVVSHSREGVGEIVGVQGTGKMARLKVLFVSGEEKTVMRRFVRLM
ncbi:MAG: ATP-dependent DNA helicase PcrA [Myxococcales bacterium]|nr:ATP-dependent DNA helicase PcrA [Myxococcales bacterium]